MTFQVSGKLWNRSLVMRDMETGSLWSHILGSCMEGALRGSDLKILAAVMTTWDDWRKKNPHTTVLNLPRTSLGYDKHFYSNPRRFVLGVVVNGKPKAFPFDLLKTRPIFEDTIEEEPVLVVFDRDSTRALMLSRDLKDRTLSFELTLDEGFLVDKETKSGWDPVRGEAVRGILKGSRLKMLPAIVSYRRSWEVFHPDSEYARSP